MNYVIVNFSDVTQAMVDDCSQTSIGSLRHSVESPDRVILSYIHREPLWVESLGLQIYKHHALIQILNDPDGDWYMAPEV